MNGGNSIGAQVGIAGGGVEAGGILRLLLLLLQVLGLKFESDGDEEFSEFSLSVATSTSSLAQFRKNSSSQYFFHCFSDFSNFSLLLQLLVKRALGKLANLQFNLIFKSPSRGLDGLRMTKVATL